MWSASIRRATSTRVKSTALAECRSSSATGLRAAPGPAARRWGNTARPGGNSSAAASAAALPVRDSQHRRDAGAHDGPWTKLWQHREHPAWSNGESRDEREILKIHIRTKFNETSTQDVRCLAVRRAKLSRAGLDGGVIEQIED